MAHLVRSKYFTLGMYVKAPNKNQDDILHGDNANSAMKHVPLYSIY